MAGQREFAKLVYGEVVPGSGAAGGQFCNDVRLRNGWEAEVKRFRTGEKTLYDWLEDERERPDLVAFRADKKPWVVAIYANRFNVLTDIQIAANNVMQYTEDGMPNPAFFNEYMAAMAELQGLLALATRKELAGSEKEAAQDAEETGNTNTGV